MDKAQIFSTLSKYFDGQIIKKCLILDCDNVLWNGIAGEEDISVDQSILLFQKALIGLYDKGVLLCLCSKNEPEHIEQAFETLPIPLKKEHIILEKINHTDKAANLKAISNELNISLDSFVFADDSDYEIGMISSLIPEVKTIKIDYRNLSFIKQVTDLFSGQTPQDLNRTELYKEQKEREKKKLSFSSVEEYNASLNTVINCSLAKIDDVNRLSELS